MPTKLFFAALLSLTSTVTLCAQAQAQLHPAPTGQPDLANIAGDLTQNALFTLLGAIGLVGIIWICYILKACAQLNRPTVNTRKSAINLHLVVAGLSLFCSSCSVEQQARAAQYHATEAAESRACPMNHHYSYQADPAFNNRYPSNGYSNWYGPTYCKYCGQKIFNSRY